MRSAGKSLVPIETNDGKCADLGGLHIHEVTEMVEHLGTVLLAVVAADPYRRNYLLVS